MYFVSYTENLNEKFGAMTYCIPFLPIAFIRIRPKYKDDIPLLEHEKTHHKQHMRTFWIHPLLYMFSKKYKLKCEVEAYRVQNSYHNNSCTEIFAEFISTKYDLNISKKEAIDLLTKS